MKHSFIILDTCLSHSCLLLLIKETWTFLHYYLFHCWSQPLVTAHVTVSPQVCYPSSLFTWPLAVLHLKQSPLFETTSFDHLGCEAICCTLQLIAFVALWAKCSAYTFVVCDSRSIGSSLAIIFSLPSHLSLSIYTVTAALLLSSFYPTASLHILNQANFYFASTHDHLICFSGSHVIFILTDPSSG